MTRKTIRIGLSIGVLAAYSLGLTYCVAVSVDHNLSGICDAKARTLRDDEFVSAAIAYELKYQKRFAPELIEQYKSVADFAVSNPRCCEIERKIEADGWPPLQHATGTYYVVATLNYKVSDDTIGNVYRASVLLSRCVEPGERFGTNRLPKTVR
jgi:hypothetical protein